MIYSHGRHGHISSSTKQQIENHGRERFSVFSRNNIHQQQQQQDLETCPSADFGLRSSSSLDNSINIFYSTYRVSSHQICI